LLVVQFLNRYGGETPVTTHTAAMLRERSN